MAEVRLYKSPWRALKLLLLSSVFVIGGVWLLTATDKPAWIGWLSIGFFSSGYPVGIFHLMDRRPQIIINDTGFFDRTANKAFINWEIIRDAYPVNISGQKFICLLVDPEFKPSNRKSRFYRQAVRFNEALGAQELNLYLGQIKVDPVKLTELILSVIHSGMTDRDRREKIEKYG